MSRLRLALRWGKTLKVPRASRRLVLFPTRRGISVRTRRPLSIPMLTFLEADSCSSSRYQPKNKWRSCGLWTGALYHNGRRGAAKGRSLYVDDISTNAQMRWLQEDGHVSIFRMPGPITAMATPSIFRAAKSRANNF